MPRGATCRNPRDPRDPLRPPAAVFLPPGNAYPGVTALTGTGILALTIVLLALNAVPGAHRLGLPPGRLAVWGLVWLAGAGAATLPVTTGSGWLGVSPGGAALPLLAATWWLARAPQGTRRTGLLGLALVAGLAYALLRVLPASLPPWVSPAWAAGVVTGVVASLVPVPAPGGLVLATAGMVLGQGLMAATLAGPLASGDVPVAAAVPIHFTVAGGEAYEALAVGALTAAAMALLGGEPRPEGTAARDGRRG